MSTSINKCAATTARNIPGESPVKAKPHALSACGSITGSSTDNTPTDTSITPTAATGNNTNVSPSKVVMTKMFLAPEKVEAMRQQARDLLQKDEETADAIDVICDANGWTRDDFIMNRHQFTFLELFLIQFPTIQYIKYFPNLTTVKLMHIALKEVDAEDFAKLINLEVLWLSENDLTTIRGGGLKVCRKLRELYIHNNMFSQLDLFLNLPELEILFADNNRFSSIEGMHTLPKLRVLSLAANNISTIRGVFDQCPSLEELNLAANKISSFREIPGLNMLPKLTQLFFSEPVHGYNPVALMSNYQTFTLCHVKRITYLDSIYITPEQRVVAETTFAKKRIYYSMRLHTMARNLTFLCTELLSRTSKVLSETEESIVTLYEMQSLLEQEMYDATYVKGYTMGVKLDTVRSAVERVERAISMRRREITELRKGFESTQEDMRESALRFNAKLLLELDTGGNVRLEDGRPKDMWVQSCTELLRNRFFPSDFTHFAAAGIKDVKVVNVTRIHNRALRSGFDRELEKLVDITDPSYKRALEYLFYAFPTQGCSEVINEREAMESIIEYGFRDLISSDAAHGAVPMTNSVYLADQVRLMDVAKKNEFRTSNKALYSRIVAAKVFLGRSSLEKGASSSTQANIEAPLLRAGRPIDRRDYPKDVLSAYRCRPDDPKQRIWYCFDDALVLPEYIIEFVYTSSIDSVPTPAMGMWPTSRNEEMATKLHEVFPTAAAVDMSDFKHMAPYFLSFLSSIELFASNAQSIRDTESIVSNVKSIFPKERDATVKDGEFSDVFMKHFATKCGGKLPTVLRFTKHGLTRIAPKLTSLLASDVKELDLSNNDLRLRHYDWLMMSQTFPAITELRLTNNHISELPGVNDEGQHVKFLKLKELYLTNNCIAHSTNLLRLRESFPVLTHLDISLNPVMMNESGYRNPSAFIILVCCPSSVVLFNGSPAESVVPNIKYWKQVPTKVDEKVAVGILKRVSEKLFGSNNSNKNVDVKCGAIDPLSMEWLFASARDAFMRSGESYTKWFGAAGDSLSATRLSAATDVAAQYLAILSKTQYFSVCDGFLTALPSMLSLTTLVHLQLKNHFITELDDSVIRKLISLESCDLRYNCIRRIPENSFSALPNLKHLDLGYNFLEDVSDMCNTAGTRLAELQFLALDNNVITTLLCFGNLINLQELYLANNKITNEKELNSLRDMLKLIILDLAGNPCVQNELYRLYTVFHMKKLKVLDGVAVDTEEATKARDTFAGRVSAELINERIAPQTNWGDVTDLNLSSSALKEVLLLEDFTSLTCLHLEHNSLSQLEGVKVCSKLLTLNVAYNKLGDNPIGVSMASLTLLESLSLESNGINNLSALQLDLPRLKFLNLSGNELTKLDGTEKLGALRELVLNKNKLRSLDRGPLINVTNLRTLYCDDNMLKNLENLQVLRYLVNATFVSNRLSDIQELLRSFEAMPVVSLSLLGNAVIRKPTYRAGLIHALQLLKSLDGRLVTQEERDRVEAAYETACSGVGLDVRMPMGGGAPIVVTSIAQGSRIDLGDPIVVGGGHRDSLMVIGTAEPIIGAVNSPPSSAIVAPRTSNGEGVALRQALAQQQQQQPPRAEQLTVDPRNARYVPSQGFRVKSPINNIGKCARR